MMEEVPAARKSATRALSVFAVRGRFTRWASRTAKHASLCCPFFVDPFHPLPRQRQPPRLPPVQDRLDDVRFQQREGQDAPDIGAVDGLGGGEFAD
jgi:hypothetical protein